MSLHLFLVAGEPSGDRLGAALMRGLKALVPGVSFTGIGGPLMQAEGMQSLFPMSELSVMGIAEILPKYVHLKRRIRQTAEQVLAQAPDALITIDSPDFCLRVAKLVKSASNIRTIHYVAPTVWAWRSGRAAKMAQFIDHVLALFPFEPPFMQAEGITCDFVGHPVVAEPRPDQKDIGAFRAAHGIAPDQKLLLLLPGSRKAEVTRLAPVFGEVFARLTALHPTLRAVLPAAGNVRDTVVEELSRWNQKPDLIDASDEEVKRTAFAAADLALAASGTVSLELAAARTPMVIAYDMNWMTRKIMLAMLKVDTLTLVNLVTDTRVVPELLGVNCRAENIVPEIENIMSNPDAQLEAMTLTMKRLGLGGEAPGLRAAHSVLGALGRDAH